MIYKVKDIAEYFLALGKDADEPVSNLKIQKLCYYAQGLYLALHSTPLFEEKIEAWTHGPVCRELYDLYKGNGSDGITPDKDYNYDKLSTDVKDFLNEVYQVYGQFSAWKLRNMTHSETPWMDAYKNESKLITNESLTVFFKTRLN
ncbi:MAG: Panacea domain-containing protein [Candidatus Puniceispirillales bacterium WSBS_2018_MAG_OTU23]